MFFVYPFAIKAQETQKNINPIKSQDTLSQKAEVVKLFNEKDTLSTQDLQKKKHLDSLNINKKKDSVLDEEESPAMLKKKVTYKSKDHISINQNTKKIYLYNNATVTYGDTKLDGGRIRMDYNNQNVQALPLKDTINPKNTQMPFFKQAQDEIKPDSIIFNYDSKKALIWNSRKKQQDGSYIKSKSVKRLNDSVYFMSESKLTTSKDVDNPEYFFKIRKSKMVGGSRMIAGPTNMYVADVPTIIAVPFIYVPISRTSASGILFPTYGEAGDRGYYLQNGGYYLHLGDRMDISLTGDYYTNASYGFRVASSYKVRYKFSGNLNFRYESLVTGERGVEGYSKSNIWNIQLSHSKSSKSAPNSTLSASINMGSSSYYRQSLNQLNTPNFLNNVLNSSVSYSKSFPAYPSTRISVGLSHSQNNNTKIINMTLPTFQGSMERIYPFAPKEGLKKGIIKNINFQYSVTAQNKINTTDSLFFTSKMFEDSKNGIKHDIPIATNFKVFKYFSVSASTNFSDTWQFQTIRKKDYNAETKKIKIDTIKEFDRFAKYSFSSSIGTTIYGMFDFGTDKKIQAIRHVMRPSIGFSYSPDQKEFYDEYISNAAGKVQEYTRFEGGIYGTPTNTKTGNISLSLSNNFEAKVKDKDTTKIEPKKIQLLNSLNFSTGYNMLADSLNWSPVSVSTGANFLKNKLNINIRASLDPYAVTGTGNRINKFNINNGGSLFRLTSASANLSYSISSDNFKDNKKETDNRQSGGREDDLFGRTMDTNTKAETETKSKTKTKQSDKKEYYNFRPDWSLRISQSVGYNNSRRENEFTANSFMFSGTFSPAESWKITFNSGYDFEKSGFTYTNFGFQKDLKSWKLSFSWSPLNSRPTWNFFIGIKAGLFKDIKYEERGVPDKRL